MKIRKGQRSVPQSKHPLQINWNIFYLVLLRLLGLTLAAQT